MSIPVMKSPGVYISEVDLSAYAAIMNESMIFGLVTLAQNGPIGQVTDISSLKEYEDTFGYPISAGGIAATELLKVTSSVKIVRLAGSSATARSLTLKGSAGSTAIDNAVIVSYKYKGTLFSDAIKGTVTPVSGATDKFNLKIVKGDDEEVLLDKNYTIVKNNATDEYPYLIADDTTDFVFTLGTENELTALTAITDAVFSLGDNGTTFTDDQVKAAIDLFDDAENIELDVLAAPGINTPAAIARLVLVAGGESNRKDTLAIIDPPQGLTPSEMADFANGTSEAYPIAKLDDSYAATYYPWGKMYNEYSGANEWMPPSVGVLKGMATEYKTYPRWTAPAGTPRFYITVFTEMEKTLTRADRDTLYESNVNPICNYKTLGLTAMGQKTTQRKLTATNRINVRLLVNYVKKLADYSTTPFLFTQITEETFNSWIQVISKQLENIKVNGGLYDYDVKMDWETVTDEMLNNNIMPGVIQIKPTKTAEFIPIDVVIRNKSDEF